MRNTFIKPVDNLNKTDILKCYNKAIYVNEIFNGHVNHINGTYALIGNGFISYDGELRNFVSQLEIRGNILEDISEIDYIGCDFFNYASYCTKLSQNIRVGIGSPSISISNIKSEGVMYE